MRKIRNLDLSEKQTLEEGHRNSIKAHFRTRCHAILMSESGYKVSEISELYKVQPRTVYKWFNKWEKGGISGLIFHKGRGIKARLDNLSKEEEEIVKKAVELNPQSLKIVCENLSKSLDFKVTKNMLKRLLKKN